MDFSLLQKSPLFKSIPICEIEKIMSGTPFKVRNYRAGSLIMQSGDPVKSFIIVINGVVKGEMIDYAGKVIKIEDIPAPGALASAFIFGSRNSYPVNVISVTDSGLLIIGRDSFIKLLREDNRILVNFLDMISNRSQFLSEKIKFLNFKTIKGKLAQFILQKAGNDKSSIVLDMTQNDLADFFGVARPSVARAIGEMEEEGLIEAKGKKIMILDRINLSRLTSD